MERESIIKKIDFLPCVPNVVVKKKTGGIRVCVGLVHGNKAIIPSSYPLPTFDELSCKLHGSKVFTKLDMRWSYLQCPLAKESRYLTAFNTVNRVYQFKRMAVGLASAPAAFQKIVTEILHGILGCFNLLGDVIVYGNTIQEHDERPQTVLTHFVEHIMLLQVAKCDLGKSETEFNGHVISD